jgi:hypothetical protein
MKHEPTYEYESTLAIAGKTFAAHEHDGFHVYALSKMRDEVTLKLRRQIKGSK